MVTGTAQQMFVGGEWRPSQTGETFSASSPATGEPIGSIPEGDRDDARAAIASARSAADGWARLTAFERAAKMHAIGDIIESRRDELARTLTLDQGKPLASEAFDEVDFQRNVQAKAGDGDVDAIAFGVGGKVLAAKSFNSPNYSATAH